MHAGIIPDFFDTHSTQLCTKRVMRPLNIAWHVPTPDRIFPDWKWGWLRVNAEETFRAVNSRKLEGRVVR